MARIIKKWGVIKMVDLSEIKRNLSEINNRLNSIGDSL